MALNNLRTRAGEGATTTTSSTSSTPTPLVTEGLLATDITTGLVNTTLAVSQAGNILQTISLADTTLWFVQGAAMQIYGKDQQPITLNFTNTTEALNAQDRVNSAFGLGNIIS